MGCRERSRQVVRRYKGGGGVLGGHEAVARGPADSYVQLVQFGANAAHREALVSAAVQCIHQHSTASQHQCSAAPGHSSVQHTTSTVHSSAQHHSTSTVHSSVQHTTSTVHSSAQHQCSTPPPPQHQCSTTTSAVFISSLQITRVARDITRASHTRCQVTRHDFAVGNKADPYFKWRGARGSRVLVSDQGTLDGSGAGWREASMWYLDKQGLQEHLRRQVWAIMGGSLYWLCVSRCVAHCVCLTVFLAASGSLSACP